MAHVHSVWIIRVSLALTLMAIRSPDQAAGQTLPPAPPAATAVTAPSLDQRREDRGPGQPTSMFGTYIRGGELLVYPFVEHYRDRNFEYKPSEFGFAGDVDHRGRYRASEALFFLAYGLTDDLAVELEGAVIRASLEKAAADRSEMPARIAESGVGDIEGQIRWRWKRETDTGPEAFSYFEAVSPRNRDKLLIGTSDWELKLGTGVVRGFGWGTLTARAAVEYAAGSSSKFDLGEYAVEYLKRLSPRWRIYAGVEGTQDEVSFVGEAQWFVRPNLFVKFNSGVGLTSKATDWAPELGVVFAFPRR
jgi:hypothetical protein